MPLPYSTLSTRLEEHLGAPLPGHEAQLTMAPRYPARRSDLSVEDRDCREAGVLILLLPHDEEPAVVLTVRREHLPVAEFLMMHALADAEGGFAATGGQELRLAFDDRA